MRLLLAAIAALATASFAAPWDPYLETRPTPQTITAACPPNVQHAEIVDVPLGHAAQASVDCLAHHGVVTVGEDGRLRVDDQVTAAELRDWLAVVGELVEVREIALPQAGEDPLTRGRLAEALAAVLRGAGAAPFAARVPFDDVGRDDAVNPAVVAGLVPVATRDRFGVDEPADRALAVTGVARTLAYLAEHTGDVRLAAPSGPVWGEVPPGRHAFLPLPDAGDDAYAIDSPVLEDGTHARFDPCRPVGVVANLEHAPPFAEDAIVEALDAISVATGTRWELHGETDEQLDHGLSRRPGIGRDRHGQRRYAPVLITWPRDWPSSWTGHDALALAEAKMIEGEEIVTGSIRMNPDEDWRYEQLLWVLLHELGHVAGLGHADDPGQVMHGTVADFPDDPAYQAGDLAGLARLGRAVGCF